MNNTMKTTDLWLATFLIKDGFPLKDYEKLGHRKVSFEFNMTDSEWKSAKLRYRTSDFSKFEQEMAKLRELCYE